MRFDRRRVKFTRIAAGAEHFAAARHDDPLQLPGLGPFDRLQQAAPHLKPQRIDRRGVKLDIADICVFAPVNRHLSLPGLILNNVCKE